MSVGHSYSSSEGFYEEKETAKEKEKHTQSSNKSSGNSSVKVELTTTESFGRRWAKKLSALFLIKGS
jgi:hypothetical protein